MQTELFTIKLLRQVPGLVGKPGDTFTRKLNAAHRYGWWHNDNLLCVDPVTELWLNHKYDDKSLFEILRSEA